MLIGVGFVQKNTQILFDHFDDLFSTSPYKNRSIIFS